MESSRSIKFKTFLQQMSESERESATNPSDYNEISPERPPQLKKKHIRKEKRDQPAPAAKLTKEERAKMQKEKNREAAQRSRDQHKEYVRRLEKEVRELRVQVDANRKFCSRCRQELDCQLFEAALKNDIQDGLAFPQQEGAQLQSEQMGMDAVEEGHVEAVDADYFLRGKEDEDYCYMKMIIFVAMVVIGVAIYPTAPQGRKLVQLSEVSESQSLVIAYSTADTGHPITQIGSFSDEKCLDSLLTYDLPSPLANLRRSSPDSSNNGAFFCSYQHPSSTFGSVSSGPHALRLFAIGSQIQKWMGGNSGMGGFIDGIIQPKGIYRIGAQVRSLELTNTHNCQLM